MGKVLIINYPTLENVGGIEKLICNLTEYMINHGARVLWIGKKGEKYCAKSFKDVMCDPRVTKVNLINPNLTWFCHDEIQIDKNDDAVMIAFTPMELAKNEYFIKKHQLKNVIPFYIVPNTIGKSYYLETYFSNKFVRSIVWRFMRGNMLRWEKMGVIRFCAKLQIESLEQSYKIKIHDKDNKLVLALNPIPPLDVEMLRVKCKSKSSEFNIITVGRFDFPHKGYMLGLVRTFGRLRGKYPQLRLTIVGFGPDEKVLRDEIEKLPVEFQQGIRMTGEVPPKELKSYFGSSHLNVSVAGAVSAGARCGCLSLIARNYCDDECEVYGIYSNDSKHMTVSRDKGELVDSYIENVINMPEEEYMENCKKCYETCLNKKVDPDYLYRWRKEVKYEPIQNVDIMKFRVLNYAKRIRLILGFTVFGEN